jgi:hypothetical protein
VTALSVTTDVLIGAAAVCAGVTLYFTIKEATAEPRRAETRRAAGVRASPSGISIVGTF